MFALRDVMCAHFTVCSVGAEQRTAFSVFSLLFCARLKQANQEVNGPNLLVIPQDVCNVR